MLTERARKFWKGSIIVLVGFTLWFGWPVYGFVSNQFESARLPWGWTTLPVEAPRDETVLNPAYTAAGSLSMEALGERRKQISAPSISAAVSIDGELVWAGAIGWRDVANKAPATTQTGYRIGSTSKAVTITGLARLVADGIMELDTPISTYSDNLPNEAWAAFTPRQLASHTAGLTTYEENNDWIGLYQSMALTTRFTDPQDALSVFDDAALLFEPSESFHYSGFDNVLLSAVMQDVTGQSFNKIMSSYVFEPLGLASIQPDHLRTKQTEFALSYQAKGDRVKPWRQVDISHKLAAGGYVSTPSDLAVLGAAWLNEEIIPTDIRDDFWTPVRLANGEVNEQDYALGFRRKSWPIGALGELVHLNHGGVSKGAQCWLMIIPEHRTVIAISTNRRTDQFFDFADVYADLLDAFISAKVEIK